MTDPIAPAADATTEQPDPTAPSSATPTCDTAAAAGPRVVAGSETDAGPPTLLGGLR